MTRAFAEFASASGPDDLPDSVRREARRAIADCIGGALAGAGEPVTLAALQAAPGAGCSTLWGRQGRASARDAALVNGCAAHAHALDDTNESMRGHPSAPIVPAVLALAEETDAAGADIVTAYAIGVEIAAKLGRSVNDRHAQVGWHTTCTLGTIGAAAASARLLRLDADRTAHALGIAASMAGGLRVNFATMTKALHAGLAAQNGVLAARLAAGGLTSSPQALEGHEGFLQLFCDDGTSSPARALATLGSPFELASPGIVFKQYPTCSLMHALIDMVLEARAAGAFDASVPPSVHCGISARLETARGKRWPRSGAEAKFHVEYCVATALLAGTQGLPDFTDAALDRPGLRALANSISLAQGADFPAGNGDFAELRVVREGTEVFRARRAKPLGHPSAPMPDALHREKFMRYATTALAPKRATALWSALADLDHLRARELGALLASVSPIRPSIQEPTP
ncbi:MmgE/PrpD family protein [Variovorax sp. M-6]|uniref:MmgE/PrpD family protein n=1 Tax=Variovorax sp. M-6 TaxID=3233041 RepID=UPI003F944D30